MAVVVHQEAIIHDQQEQLTHQSNRISALESSESESGVGSTYVRWGRTVCPGDAELVYEGTYVAVNYSSVPVQIWFPANYVFP